jgi:hypothetical protein
MTTDMAIKTNTKRLPLFCQCQDCLEHFTLEGLINGGHIVELEPHPKVGHNGNGDYYHRCGGNGHRGRLTFYPVLRPWRS